jgi:PKD repeat protein
LVNIRNGTYTEIVDIHTKNNITFRGQSRSGTVIAYANNGNLNASTHFEDVFKVNGNDISVDNLTLNDPSGVNASPAQALMLETNIKRFILNNAEVDSYQDTILANTSGTQGYFKNSLIQGSVDYIWGGGNLFITNCEFKTLRVGGNITQPRTDPGSNGMAFVNCQVTRNSNGVTGVTLGRAIGIANGNAAFINCLIDTNAIIGWDPSSVSISRYWEYGNSNLTATAAVTYNGTILTNGDPNLACAQSASCWLYGWVPQLPPNILTNPVSITVTAGMTATFNVAATGIPDPSYQWLFNTTNVLAGATNASLSISIALAANAGAYSVIVSNGAGSVTSSPATLIVVGTGPTASFTTNPTSGTEPLGVTFTDTSSGSPNITLFWDFGDNSQATNAGGSIFVHTYAAGTYTVTLTASNAFGANSTLVSNNLINVITAFQAWQVQYFGSTTNPAAAPDADPLGKGMSNTDQFLAGLNPTNPTSVFQIISTVQNTTDVVVVWKTAGVRTNAVQATAGDGNGGYVTTNFTDISGSIIIGVTGDTTTNYTDVGGATNSPARYYRIRLVP